MYGLSCSSEILFKYSAVQGRRFDKSLRDLLDAWSISCRRGRVSVWIGTVAVAFSKQSRKMAINWAILSSAIKNINRS